MGVGLAQIGILLLLTVVGLPLFFFGLMAALDRFERSLSDQPRHVAPPPISAPPVAEAAGATPRLAIDASVMALPVTPAAPASQPAAAV